MKKSKRVEADDRPAEPVVDAESFGTWLRRQREGRDIGLREISEQSKISLRYLQALESGRFDILPAPVFAKGFLRHYARYVGLDPEEVVNAYLAARSSGEEDELDDRAAGGARSVPPNGRRRSLGLVLGIAVLLLLLALVYLAERWRRTDADPVPPSAAAVTRPTTPIPAPVVRLPEQEEAPAVAAVPAAPIVVDLDFTGECWVEARVDGERALSETRVQGEAVRFLADERVELRFGDASVVTVEVNGWAMPIEARSGRVETVVIDLETVRRFEAGASP